MTKKGHPKNQHYVPQFLLRNFSTGNKKRVFTFDKSNGKQFLSSTRNLASETKFYDVELDGKQLSFDPFLTRMEASVSGIIKSVVKRESLVHLTEKDRVSLSLFSAVQQLRVKGTRQRMASINNGIRRVLAERGIEPGDVVPEMTPEDIKRQSIAQISEAKQTAKHFHDKSWILYRAPKQSPFITSDNPIVLHNLAMLPEHRGSGLTSPGVEVHFPISKRLSICFLCPSTERALFRGLAQVKQIGQFCKAFPIKIAPMKEIADAISKGTVLELNRDNVMHQNSLQVLYSSRFLFSSTDNFDLVKDMLAADPTLADPPEMVVR